MTSPTGAILRLSDEMLYRQVSPSFLKVGNVLSSQVFRPTSKDGGLLSVDRSSLVDSSESSLIRFNGNGGRSMGVLGATIEEFGAQGLNCHEETLPFNPAHAVANFQGLTRGQCESKSKVLLAYAETRGYLYQLPTE
jgi:hypothetical protein